MMLIFYFLLNVSSLRKWRLVLEGQAVLALYPLFLQVVSTFEH
jgi:hypothetical protein